MKKIAISAPSHFSDFDLLKASLDSLITSKNDVIFCSETISCVSILKRYADENDLKLILFFTDWEKHQALADKVRDKEMIEQADELLLFNYGKNKKSDFLKSQAAQKGIITHEIKINSINIEIGSTYNELDKLNSFQELISELKILEENKSLAIKQMNFEYAAGLRDKIRFVNQKLESLN